MKLRVVFATLALSMVCLLAEVVSRSWHGPSVSSRTALPRDRAQELEHESAPSQGTA